jgi:DNA-binding transcriptional MerR regulator
MVTTDQPVSILGWLFPWGKAHSEVMRLLSIGEFARQSRLSPKALRIYDEMGILPPARTDANNGYRWYDPAQLERAGLAALLRQLGLPLEEVRRVLGADAQDAVAVMSRYWERTQAEHRAHHAVLRKASRTLTWPHHWPPDTVS